MLLKLAKGIIEAQDLNEPGSEQELGEYSKVLWVPNVPQLPFGAGDKNQQF